jgi:hypothetical protein
MAHAQTGTHGATSPAPIGSERTNGHRCTEAFLRAHLAANPFLELMADVAFLRPGQVEVRVVEYRTGFASQVAASLRLLGFKAEVVQ